MNITLLVYLEDGSDKYDKSIDQIGDALRAAGHKTSVFGVRGDVSKLITGLRRRKPDLVFNLLEQFNEQMLGLVEATAVLELLGVPYTGGGAGELFLQEDKTLTKKLLAASAAGIEYADLIARIVEHAIERRRRATARPRLRPARAKPQAIRTTSS